MSEKINYLKEIKIKMRRLSYRFWKFVMRFLYQEHFIARLNEIPKTEWARISCMMNCSNTPVEIKSVLPKWYKEYHSKTWFDSRSYRKLMIYIIFADYIKDSIGEFEVNKYWNTTYKTDPDKMTEEQHLNWWNNERLNNF